MITITSVETGRSAELWSANETRLTSSRHCCPLESMASRWKLGGFKNLRATDSRAGAPNRGEHEHQPRRRRASRESVSVTEAAVQLINTSDAQLFEFHRREESERKLPLSTRDPLVLANSFSRGRARSQCEHIPGKWQLQRQWRPAGRGNNITIDNVVATDVQTTGTSGGLNTLNLDAIQEIQADHK